MTTLYYTLKQTHDNKYFINDLQVDYKTFDKIFLNSDRYKQINYTCYFDKAQNFIRQWDLKEV